MTNPTHYDLPIPPIDFIEANGIGFIEGNIIKYVCRYKRKDGLKDLEKARHYLDMLIEKERAKQ
jgi:hypothetical protein